MKLVRRLLIVGCSNRKQSTSSLLPAIQRYDGPTFRVLRAYLRRNEAPQLDVFVLSAEFGLIPAGQLVPAYDRKMTTERADQLRPNVRQVLQQVLPNSRYSSCLICCSTLYHRAIGTLEIPGAVVTTTPGSHGRSVAELYVWLRGSPPPTPDVRTALKPQVVKFHGVIVRASVADINSAIREGLENDPNGVHRYHAWYVPFGEERVSSKWLAGRLSGIPVSAFCTDDARRLLAKLGVEVRHI